MNVEIRNANKGSIYGVLLYSLVSLLIIFYKHHFYDDEIFNLSKMLWSYSKIFATTQSSDVHPPLSYLINKFLFDIRSSYKGILIFSIIINALSLGYLYGFLEKRLEGTYSKILLFMFVFLNGGLLLWTNSVRWYAYWVPLFIVLYTYILKHQSLNKKDIIFVSFLLSIATYINYITFILLVTLCVYWLLLRRNDLTLKNVLLFCLIYFFFSAYQIIIFITVHMQNKESQLSDLFNSALNAIYGVLNGGSIFIADPVFLLFSASTLIIIIIGLRNTLTSKHNIDVLLLQSIILLVVMLSLMILTGVSGKYRNNIALSIPFYFIVSIFFDTIKNINIKRGYIFIVFILSMISTLNLVTHSNTSKNSYNMPITKLDNILNNPQGKILFTYAPSIFFFFSNKGYKVYYTLKDQDKINIAKGTEVFLVKTYPGSLSDEKHQRVIKLYKNISNKIGSVKVDKLGMDRYAKIKNMLPGNRPKIDKVQIYVLHGTLKKKLSVSPWKSKLETK